MLQQNPRILFRLRCRKFVEMMRFSSAPAPTRKPSSKSLKSKLSTSTATDEVFEQEMELDGLTEAGDDWDRMETEEADGRYGTFEERMGEALKYAQELKQDYKDDKSKEVTDSLQEIFSLWAYEDSRNTPTAHVLDPSGRVPVAEELNSAILGKKCNRPSAYILSDILKSPLANPPLRPSNECVSRRKYSFRTSATTQVPVPSSTWPAISCGDLCGKP